jgi:acyl-CoA reductase-like NAD-dependent aldehyde dehydrogenase
MYLPDDDIIRSKHVIEVTFTNKTQNGHVAHQQSTNTTKKCTLKTDGTNKIH